MLRAANEARTGRPPWHSGVLLLAQKEKRLSALYPPLFPSEQLGSRSEPFSLRGLRAIRARQFFVRVGRCEAGTAIDTWPMKNFSLTQPDRGAPTHFELAAGLALRAQASSTPRPSHPTPAARGPGRHPAGRRPGSGQRRRPDRRRRQPGACTPSSPTSARCVGRPVGDVAISQRGGVPLADVTFHYSLFYRNAAAFCTPATYNWTNAYTIVCTP